MPFKKGTLGAAELSSVHVKDGDRSLPLQCEITSKWDDDSVRYLYIHFLADLPGNARKELDLTWSEPSAYTHSPEAPVVDLKPIHISEALVGYAVNNGPLNFIVDKGADQLFETLSYKGKEISGERFVGPLVRVQGKTLKTCYDSWNVVKEGPILAVLEGKGRCLLKSGASFSGDGIHFEVRLTITAGKPWVDVAFRLINCTEGDLMPDDIVLGIKASEDYKLSLKSPDSSHGSKEVPNFKEAKYDEDDCGYSTATVVGTKHLKEFDAPTDPRTIVGRSNYRTTFKISKYGQQVANYITAETIAKEGNEHFSEVFYGTFFGDYTDPDKDIGVCATIYQAFQNFPKAISADPDGLTIFLLPDQKSCRKNTKAEPVVFTSGMAREQKVLLHFHDAAEPI